VLASAVGVDDLWISSHQGGHRFAANVVVLPQGVQLGRVSVEEAARVVGEALDGRVPSSGYRGRTTYPPEAQAAEVAIRAASGLDGIADLRLTGIEGRRVSFRDTDGHEHVAVVETARGPVVPASCGAEPEPHAVLTARVL
jgi:(2Fe-2S) ferredoxin